MNGVGMDIRRAQPVAREPKNDFRYVGTELFCGASDCETGRRLTLRGATKHPVFPECKDLAAIRLAL